MQGSPLWRCIGVLFGVVLMGIPVWCLTHRAPVTAVVPNMRVSANENFTLTLTFSQAPLSFSVTKVDQILFSGTGPQTDFKAPFSLALPAEGVDLLLKVQWPNGVPHSAVEVKVENAQGVLGQETFWGADGLTEIVTLRPEKK